MSTFQKIFGNIGLVIGGVCALIGHYDWASAVLSCAILVIILNPEDRNRI